MSKNVQSNVAPAPIKIHIKDVFPIFIFIFSKPKYPCVWESALNLIRANNSPNKPYEYQVEKSLFNDNNIYLFLQCWKRLKTKMRMKLVRLNWTTVHGWKIEQLWSFPPLFPCKRKWPINLQLVISANKCKIVGFCTLL